MNKERAQFEEWLKSAGPYGAKKPKVTKEGRGRSKRAKRKLRAELERLKRLPYREYLKTKHWKQTRRKRIRKSRYRCDRCGARGRLQVHHKHYRSLGREVMVDLETLCVPCHQGKHEGLIEADNHLRCINGLGPRW